MKQNITEQIYNFLEGKPMVHFKDIEKFADTIPCKHETAFRKCRDLIRENRIWKFDKDMDLIPENDKSTTIIYYQLPYSLKSLKKPEIAPRSSEIATHKLAQPPLMPLPPINH